VDNILHIKKRGSAIGLCYFIVDLILLDRSFKICLHPDLPDHLFTWQIFSKRKDGRIISKVCPYYCYCMSIWLEEKEGTFKPMLCSRLSIPVPILQEQFYTLYILYWFEDRRILPTTGVVPHTNAMQCRPSWIAFLLLQIIWKIPKELKHYHKLIHVNEVLL